MIRRKLTFILLTSFVFVAASEAGFAQELTFRKVNTGTRSHIELMAEGIDNSIFFQTNKIYRLEKNGWQKADIFDAENIFVCCPVERDNIWFTVFRETYTCILYHYFKGTTSLITTPFTNHISLVHFFSRDSALFAGPSDMAVYINGRFRLLPSVPTRNNVIRLVPCPSGEFFVVTSNGELFRYYNNSYQRIPTQSPVNDFCLGPADQPYFIAGATLYSLKGTTAFGILTDSSFRWIRAVRSLSDGTLLMAGDNGMLLRYSGAGLHRLPSFCSDNLTGILTTKSGDTWVYGDNGRVLYSGSSDFPVYVENRQGFALHKLIDVGISTDDEYGVAIADFNADQKADIYTVRISEQNRLYINYTITPDQITKEKGFRDESIQRNATGSIDPMDDLLQGELKMGVAVADVDNDHDQDIYLCYLNSNNKLLLNNGDGYFRNVSTQDGRACQNLYRSNAAAFADVDLDGDLDLFATSEDGSNRFFENDGTGHFSDVTLEAGLMSPGGGMCAAFGDVDGDGLPDLCVSFWYPGNRLYLNRSVKGKIRFRDASGESGLMGSKPAKSNAVVLADVNNDGILDLFIANRNDYNKIYINDGKGRFTDMTSRMFEPRRYLSNGAVFADFDLDGFLDLYVTNVGGNVLFHNDKGCSFTDVTSESSAELSGYGTGCAVGDIDSDGDPDLYLANYINGNSMLLLNINETRNFIKMTLKGIRSNRDAIGAKVWLYRTGRYGQHQVLAGYREVTAGNGYGSTSAKEIIFGVEKGIFYRALIKFPGTTDTLSLFPLISGQTREVMEIEGFDAFRFQAKESGIRFFRDRENQPEFLKFFLVIVFLVLYNIVYRKDTREVRMYRLFGSLLIFILFALINRFYLFSGFGFGYFIPLSATFGFVTILHLYISRSLLVKLARKEKQELREKLSRDLHDDLASTLGSISIYTETLKGMSTLSSPETVRLSDKISTLTQTVMHSISDIIWMTSPRNDSLQSLVSKTSNYMYEILTDNHIGFTPRIEIPDEPVILREELRNDAFLILKEGLNNIIRHARAREVIFTVTCRPHQCEISLKDDGCGMNLTPGGVEGSQGNGLANMRHRAKDSSIGIRISSVKECGTEILLQIAI